jgi:4-hydroxybenzoate polyprenyltransferase
VRNGSTPAEPAVEARERARTDAAAPPARSAATKLREYARLMRLDRPIGAWLLLWPALWALWIAAAGKPDELLFVIFVAGTLLARSAGCVINDFADRRYDPHVRRTADRPLARGTVTTTEALVLFAALGAAALALVVPLNRPAQLLALCGGVVTVIYPFLKRFFPLPQAWLGIAFAWSIPMAFAAQTGSLPPVAWVLFAAAGCWIVAYDTIYAMVDREDDLRIGVRSSAILFGRSDRLIVGLLQASSLALLAIAGAMSDLGRWYAAGLVVAAWLAIEQLHMIRTREPAKCFAAFLANNWFGCAVFVGIALDYVFR